MSGVLESVTVTRDQWQSGTPYFQVAWRTPRGARINHIASPVCCDGIPVAPQTVMLTEITVDTERLAWVFVEIDHAGAVTARLLVLSTPGRSYPLPIRDSESVATPA